MVNPFLCSEIIKNSVYLSNYVKKKINLHKTNIF